MKLNMAFLIQQYINNVNYFVGEGDTGDHWLVLCDGDFWDRDEKVMLKHIDTDMYVKILYFLYIVIIVATKGVLLMCMFVITK